MPSSKDDPKPEDAVQDKEVVVEDATVEDGDAEATVTPAAGFGFGDAWGKQLESAKSMPELLEELKEHPDCLGSIINKVKFSGDAERAIVLSDEFASLCASVCSGEAEEWSSADGSYFFAVNRLLHEVRVFGVCFSSFEKGDEAGNSDEADEMQSRIAEAAQDTRNLIHDLLRVSQKFERAPPIMNPFGARQPKTGDTKLIDDSFSRLAARSLTETFRNGKPSVRNDILKRIYSGCCDEEEDPTYRRACLNFMHHCSDQLYEHHAGAFHGKSTLPMLANTLKSCMLSEDIGVVFQTLHTFNNVVSISSDSKFKVLVDTVQTLLERGAEEGNKNLITKVASLFSDQESGIYNLYDTKSAQKLLWQLIEISTDPSVPNSVFFQTTHACIQFLSFNKKIAKTLKETDFLQQLVENMYRGCCQVEEIEDFDTVAHIEGEAEHTNRAELAKDLFDTLATSTPFSLVFDTIADLYQANISSENWKERYGALAVLVYTIEGYADKMCAVYKPLLADVLSRCDDVHNRVRHQSVCVVSQMLLHLAPRVQIDMGAEVTEVLLQLTQNDPSMTVRSESLFSFNPLFDPSDEPEQSVPTKKKGKIHGSTLVRVVEMLLAKLDSDDAKSNDTVLSTTVENFGLIYHSCYESSSLALKLLPFTDQVLERIQCYLDDEYAYDPKEPKKKVQVCALQTATLIVDTLHENTPAIDAAGIDPTLINRLVSFVTSQIRLFLTGEAGDHTNNTLFLMATARAYNCLNESLVSFTGEDLDIIIQFLLRYAPISSQLGMVTKDMDDAGDAMGYDSDEELCPPCDVEDEGGDLGSDGEEAFAKLQKKRTQEESDDNKETIRIIGANGRPQVVTIDSALFDVSEIIMTIIWSMLESSEDAGHTTVLKKYKEDFMSAIFNQLSSPHSELRDRCTLAIEAAVPVFGFTGPETDVLLRQLLERLDQEDHSEIFERIASTIDDLIANISSVDPINSGTVGPVMSQIWNHFTSVLDQINVQGQGSGADNENDDDDDESDEDEEFDFESTAASLATAVVSIVQFIDDAQKPSITHNLLQQLLALMQQQEMADVSFALVLYALCTVVEKLVTHLTDEHIAMLMEVWMGCADLRQSPEPQASRNGLFGMKLCIAEIERRVAKGDERTVQLLPVLDTTLRNYLTSKTSKQQQWTATTINAAAAATKLIECFNSWDRVDFSKLFSLIVGCLPKENQDEEELCYICSTLEEWVDSEHLLLKGDKKLAKFITLKVKQQREKIDEAGDVSDDDE